MCLRNRTHDKFQSHALHEYNLKCNRVPTLYLVYNYEIKNIEFMEDYEDLNAYNGDAEHDIWVDYDNYENTGEPDVFDEDNLNEFSDNLNDWD